VRTITRQVANFIREHKTGLTLDHFLSVPSVGLAKAGQILSTFELARRHLLKDTIKITVIQDVLPLVAEISGKQQEYFVCISLNGANKVIEKRYEGLLAAQSQIHAGFYRHLAEPGNCATFHCTNSITTEHRPLGTTG